MIIVNFKCYEESTGANAVKLALICEKVSKEMNVPILVAVQPADIYRVSKEVTIDVYGQHADAVHYGAFTGHVIVECLKENGAVGVLLNHSEKRMLIDEIEYVLHQARNNLFGVVICVSDSEIGEALSDLLPDSIAIEPPALIGGDVSVSVAKPSIISEAYDRIVKKNKVNLLVGAGIKTKDDVQRALDLGATGILVSSGVVLSKNPEKVLREFCEAFSKF